MFPIIAAAAQAGTGALSGLFTAKLQTDAVEEASRRAAAAGQQGAQEISDAQRVSEQYAREGQLQALQQYELARRYAEGQHSQLGQYYDQARQVGGSALQRYQNAILQNGRGAVYSDPAFGFRQQQAAGAANAVAARAGIDPALMQQTDWSTYNQQLANDEYANALQRLQGLGAIGTDARANYASANMQSLEAINRARGAYATEQMGGNQYRAQLNQNAAAAYANSLNNLASNTSAYEIMRANALANGVANVNNAGQNGAQSLLYYYMANRPQNAPTPVAAEPNYSQYTQPATGARPAPEYFGA